MIFRPGDGSSSDSFTLWLLSQSLMKGLTLMPSDLAGHDRSSGQSLISNYLPPCLENKLLTQHQPSAPSSALLSLCPSLQPTHLSSTTSACLLSSSGRSPASTSTSSPLLSTQNRLLQAASAPAKPSTLLCTSLDTTRGTLLKRFAPLPTPSFCLTTPGSEDEESSWGGADERDGAGEETSQWSSGQEPSSVNETVRSLSLVYFF